MNQAQREEQMKQAEEILGDKLQEIGFSKVLFFGQFLHDKLLPYPDTSHDEKVNQMVADLRQYCAEKVDAVAIDKKAEIPQEVINGLGKLGVLGACLPVACGGMDLSQSAYCRILEGLGGHCGSTAQVVNGQHSHGPRARVMFGTVHRKKKGRPKRGEGAG